MFCGAAEVSATYTSSQQFSSPSQVQGRVCRVKKQIKVLHQAVTVSLTLRLKVEVVEGKEVNKGRETG